MDIKNHISQLLYRYQCVAVPGFGAFLTTTQSAKFLENSNSFVPPKKLLGFNSHLKNNDGLLANHIAQIEKISYENALKIIDTEVDIWVKTLSSIDSLTLRNLGTFGTSEDKKLIFKPYEQINYLTSSYGLNALVCPPIKRADILGTVSPLYTTEYENNIIDLKPLGVKKSNIYLKYAALLVLGLGLTGTIGVPLYQNKIESETALVKQAVQKKIQNKIQEATFFIKSPVQQVTKLNSNLKMPYHIMAGAFRNEQNAQKELEQLINRGYNAIRIPKNKYGFYPVVYGSYSNLLEAEEAKKKIRESINPEAWLLIEIL